ncbi:hypothetical protein LEAN103870_14625 [Legionella anisa]|uniref:DUF2157 domain-containing protein n=1 Tax=Legionella anisa TaxID=28082 RepID=A0AAX0WUV0_9GAMM|nr:hypothetical protein [Legionella anisa]AWN74164.1 DUF2157 domain-containing protein [Legionella anisa]KTC71448.1 membrane protein [Legionella anisa]MCW8425807.1 DUF2157 domain-containing protein [Legionella anisa]MCW8448762.1 DUF2157 domain-containing protein [Legionella anisa]PNL61935.1 DUF2157 domain-containing protein [Legionella anisa]
MKISRNMMSKAIEAKIITEKQANDLIEFIKNLPEQSPGFNLTNVLYYFGGLIAIGAMTLFMNLGWEMYGGWGILFLSVCYAILGVALTHKLYDIGYKIPAGICATFVICLTPLAIYGLQQGMGWWPDNSVYHDYHVYIKWNWFYMEMGTLIVGIIMAWIYRYPFMIMPIAVTLWYMSMDLTSMLDPENYTYELGAMVSMYFGIITVLIAFWVDVRSRNSADFAFWLYIFGVITFWGGLSAQHSDNELSKFIYLCINLLMILIGVILNRKVFVLFGALGSCYYLGYLAFKVFKLSYLFPVALTVIGFGIIYLGILWQKNEAQLTHKIRLILPQPLQDLLQSRDQME